MRPAALQQGGGVAVLCRVLAGGALALALLQAMILISIPLMPAQSDAAWYYMNVHYVLTGRYIFESWYPSFSEPSQYYPFFGYSFFLYLCHQLSAVTGAGMSGIVKGAQFLMYLASGWLIFSMARSYLKASWLPLLLLLLYLSYYPYFNFTFLVMSETLAIFLLVASVYLFLRYLRQSDSPVDDGGKGACLCIAGFMILSGWSILVKPVFLPLYLILLLLFALRTLRRRRYARLLLACLFFLLPLCQSAFSWQHYGNFQLKSGFGWNLWNRAIRTDGFIPASSANLDQLLSLAQLPAPESLQGTFWYDITKRLSQRGYKERFIQDLCGKVALDGIKEHPFRFLLNTFKNSIQEYRDGMRIRAVTDSFEDYWGTLELLRNDRHYHPLVMELAGQVSRDNGALDTFLLGMNGALAQLQRGYNLVLHNLAGALFFLLVPVLVARRALSQRNFLDYLPHAIVWLAGACVVVGSTLFEAPDDRYMLPAAIFIFFAMAQGFELWAGRRAAAGGE